LPSSARPLHIGRCAGCNSVRVTYESIRNVISAIERVRNNSGKQINGDLDRHAHAFLFLQRGLLESGEGSAADSACAGKWRASCSYLGAR
jgi:hypothetical protein